MHMNVYILVLLIIQNTNLIFFCLSVCLLRLIPQIAAPDVTGLSLADKYLRFKEISQATFVLEKNHFLLTGRLRV